LNEYHGGKEIIIQINMQSIPLFVRQGSIIPLNTGANGFQTKDLDKRELLIFPLSNDGKFST